jgi:predicted RNase H-like HicB family nuclease
LQKGAVSVKREYSVLYQPIEDGLIMATVPELPGAVTQGRNLEEARTMIKEAVELLLQSYRENALKDAPGNAIWENLTFDIPAAWNAATWFDTWRNKAATWIARGPITPSIEILQTADVRQFPDIVRLRKQPHEPFAINLAFPGHRAIPCRSFGRKRVHAIAVR